MQCACYGGHHAAHLLWGPMMQRTYRLRDPMIQIYFVSGVALFVLLTTLVVVLLTISPT